MGNNDNLNHLDIMDLKTRVAELETMLAAQIETVEQLRGWIAELEDELEEHDHE